MPHHTKQTKVLLYGNIFAKDYRSKYLLNFLHDSGYRISWVNPDFYRNRKIFSFFDPEKFLTLLCWIEILVKAFFADVIYLPPMSSRFITSALLAKKLLRKKLIIEMYISLYDTLVRDRKLENSSRQAKTLYKKDVLALKHSDFIIHTALHEVSYWETFLNIKIDKSKVFISPIFSTQTLPLQVPFTERSRSTLRICWWGTFIPLHGLENIIYAMKILKEKEVQFECTLFGVNDPLFNDYLSLIQNWKLNSHVSLRSDLSFLDGSLPNYLLENCELALGVFGSTEKAKNIVPNKLIEALSMGIPSLTMNSPALKEFFDPEVDLWTCGSDPESIAESILSINQGTAYPVNWEQTRKKVLQTFSTKQYERTVDAVLQKALATLSKPCSVEPEISLL